MTKDRLMRLPLTPEQAAEKLKFSWHFLAARGDAASRCDRFAYEEPNGVGATGNCGFLFGYRGSDCILITAVFP